ncbi:hypothetical protein ASD52_16270 [Ensifer sp. Root142]|nr:hypothetical protein ASD52_16270 [Ensifer sp. Root142]
MLDYGAVVSFAAAIAQTNAAASVVELPQKQTFMSRSWEPKLILLVTTATKVTASTARFANRTGRT